ncbi:MAG TPA: hypothetical protein PK798_04250 [Flavobacteriales bacterium]|nr:hypothetical protein [Flavobacteriales bacterium]HRJ37975.1 hypothetical protein [Flavobacteriales bacterium]
MGTIGGPSERAGRDTFQITLSCNGGNYIVVSVKEKRQRIVADDQYRAEERKAVNEAS